MQQFKSTISMQTENYIDILHDLIHEDLQLVDQFIQKSLRSKIVLINQVGHYITNSGGKRLRPILLLLIAQHFSYRGKQHVDLAAIIEFIHTATLLHDDVVDASLLRRGHETANQLWGDKASVLVGDFLYSRAFQMMIEINSIRVMEVLSETTNTIAEGEVEQLLSRHNPDITEADYIRVIRNKTAKLFEAAGRLGAILSQRSIQDEQQMAKYGLHLGTAFQLIDDVLDYGAYSGVLGKNIGDDLNEGNPTLPLLYTMWQSQGETKEIIRQAIIDGGLENMDFIQEMIKKTGAIEYTVALAQKEAQLAMQSLEHFQDSKYLQAMYNLGEFVIARQC